VLVCRLDLRSPDRRALDRSAPAWTRWTGHAATNSYAQGFSGTKTILRGVAGKLVIDISACFSSSSSALTIDVDGSEFALDVMTNDMEPPAKSTLQKVRLHYELTDGVAPVTTITADYTRGIENVTPTLLSGTAAANLATGVAVPKTWRVTKRGRTFRLNFKTTGRSVRLRLRGIDWFVRDSNRP